MALKWRAEESGPEVWIDRPYDVHRRQAATEEDMIMKRRAAGIVAAVVTASMVLSACGTTGSSSSSEDLFDDAATTAATADATAESAASSDGSTLNLRISSDPSSLDPQETLTDNLGIVYSLVYEPLVRLGVNGEATAAQAESWEVSDDGLTYTFTLRDNYWSNGEQVTADDFVWAWKRVAEGTVGTDWSDLIFDVKGMSEAFAGTGSLDDIGLAADGNQLIVTLEEPKAYFAGYTSFPIFSPVNQEYAESQGTAFGTGPVIGSGPYYVDSWEHDDLLVLKKNENYWNKDAYTFDTINVYVVSDENTALNMFINGELDEIEPTGTQVDQLTAAGYEVGSYDSGRSIYLSCNMTEEIIANDNIRKAISSAIDRETIVSNVLRDASTPATGFVPEGIAGADGKSFRELAGDTLAYTYDEAKAQEYFQAGLDELGISASDITLDILAKNDNEQTILSAALQEILQDAFGITVNVTTLDSTQYSDRRSNLDFDLCLISWGADWDDASTFLMYYYHPEGEIAAGYNSYRTYYSDAYNEIYGKSIYDTAATEAERAQYLVDAETLLLEDLPIIPLYYKGQYQAVQPNVTGINYIAVLPYLSFAGAAK